MKSRKENEKSSSKKKSRFRLNRELYACAALMVCLFAGMTAYLADYVLSNQEALFNNSYNSRQKVLAQQNTRGTIYAASGEVLAETRMDEAGNEFRDYPYGRMFAHVVGRGAWAVPGGGSRNGSKDRTRAGNGQQAGLRPEHDRRTVDGVKRGSGKGGAVKPGDAGALSAGLDL